MMRYAAMTFKRLLRCQMDEYTCIRLAQQSIKTQWEFARDYPEFRTQFHISFILILLRFSGWLWDTFSELQAVANIVILSWWSPRNNMKASAEFPSINFNGLACGLLFVKCKILTTPHSTHPLDRIRPDNSVATIFPEWPGLWKGVGSKYSLAPRYISTCGSKSFCSGRVRLPSCSLQIFLALSRLWGWVNLDIMTSW